MVNDIPVSISAQVMIPSVTPRVSQQPGWLDVSSLTSECEEYAQFHVLGLTECSLN